MTTDDKPSPRAPGNPSTNMTARTGTRATGVSSTGRVTNVPAVQDNWRSRMQTARIKFDDDQKDIYLDHLAETGLKGASADRVGVCLNTVKKHRENDPDFQEAYERALEEYRDRVVSHHTKLLFEGEKKRRYDKDGKMVEETTIFPIRLIELELKRVDPSYRDKQEIKVSTAGGVLVAPAEMTPNEWIEHQAAEGEGKERPRLEEGTKIGTDLKQTPDAGKI